MKTSTGTAPVETQAGEPAARQAAVGVLSAAYAIVPILAGFDKFLGWMVQWERYVWPPIADSLNLTPQGFIYVVGAIEILAGVLVLVAPRIGSLLVAGSLGGIAANLVMVGVSRDLYWDIALLNFGLMLGAIALFLLSVGRSRPWHRGFRRREAH